MRFFLDAMVWIYALEGHAHFGPQAQSVLRAIDHGRHTLVTSHYLLGEVLVLPVRKQDSFTIAAYRRALLRNDRIEVVSFDTAAAMNFASLRAHQRVKSPDAMHLALAAAAQVDAFITTDSRLRNVTVPGIGFIGDLSTVVP